MASTTNGRNGRKRPGYARPQGDQGTPFPSPLKTPPEQLTANRLREVVGEYTDTFLQNAALSRAQFLSRLTDPRRNYDDECGWPVGPVDPQHYLDLFERDPVAGRVVEVWPKECWQVTPSIYEVEDAEQVTEFEEACDDLAKQLRGNSKYAGNEGSPIWAALKKLDIMSGIGQYGVLLFGLDDGLPLSEPVAGWDERNSFPVGPERDDDGTPTGNETGTRFSFTTNAASVYSLTTNQGPETERKLLSLQVFPEPLAQITRYETNRTSPRYGQPTEYLIAFNDYRNLFGSAGQGINVSTERVHWSRVLHVAENDTSSSVVFGRSRLSGVLNPTLDCLKVRGGSAEMYWRGAFPGLTAETHPELGGDVDVDSDELKDVLENYMNGLQRYLLGMGLTFKTLAPTVVDPSPQIEVQIESICIRIAIPIRIFKGSERGELASTQDDVAWNDRVRERQHNSVTPRIIVPFVDRLIQFGVLPGPEEYYCWWPDIASTSQADKADVALKRTQAAGHYVQTGLNAIVPEFDYFHRFLGMEEEEVRAMLEAAEDRAAEQESGETTTGSPLLQLVGGITGAIEMFKAAKDGALSEDQLKQLMMLFFQISEGRVDDIIGDGLTPASEDAGEVPEPPQPPPGFGGPPGAGGNGNGPPNGLPQGGARGGVGQGGGGGAPVPPQRRGQPTPPPPSRNETPWYAQALPTVSRTWNAARPVERVELVDFKTPTVEPVPPTPPIAAEPVAAALAKQAKALTSLVRALAEREPPRQPRAFRLERLPDGTKRITPEDL